jgi:hypothetical protein
MRNPGLARKESQAMKQIVLTMPDALVSEIK